MGFEGRRTLFLFVVIITGVLAIFLRVLADTEIGVL